MVTRKKTFRSIRSLVLVWLVFTGLVACSAETIKGDIAANNESVSVAVLNIDPVDLVDGSQEVSKITISLEDELPEFDVLLISQDTFDDSEGNAAIKKLIEFTAENRILVVESRSSMLSIDLSDGSYSAELSLSSPPVARTLTSISGRRINGVILSPSGASTLPLSESIPKALQELKKLKQENLYEPLSLDSSIVSLLGSGCPYGQYFEVAEVSQLKEPIVTPTEDTWLIRLSQLTEANSSSCGQSDYPLSSLEAEVRLKSAEGAIVDYAPTTGSGNQMADLSDDYSWPVGPSDVTIIDVGNTPDLVKWLFDFKDATHDNSQYYLTQPGLLAYIPVDSRLDFDRNMQAEFQLKRWHIADQSQSFSADWTMRIQSNE